MWLVSCRRQVMLTQGSIPDPKWKLNISSFITLPHLLDCPIPRRNSVSIVLLLWIIVGWDRWGWLIHSRVSVGGGGGGGGGWVDWYYLMRFFVRLFFGLSYLLSFFSEYSMTAGLSYLLSFFSEYSMTAVASVSLFISCFLCPWSP